MGVAYGATFTDGGSYGQATLDIQLRTSRGLALGERAAVWAFLCDANGVALEEGVLDTDALMVTEDGAGSVIGGQYADEAYRSFLLVTDNNGRVDITIRDFDDQDASIHVGVVMPSGKVFISPAIAVPDQLALVSAVADGADLVLTTNVQYPPDTIETIDWIANGSTANGTFDLDEIEFTAPTVITITGGMTLMGNPPNLQHINARDADDQSIIYFNGNIVF